MLRFTYCYIPQNEKLPSLTFSYHHNHDSKKPTDNNRLTIIIIKVLKYKSTLNKLKIMIEMTQIRVTTYDSWSWRLRFGQTYFIIL